MGRSLPGPTPGAWDATWDIVFAYLADDQQPVEIPLHILGNAPAGQTAGRRLARGESAGLILDSDYPVEVSRRDYAEQLVRAREQLPSPGRRKQLSVPAGLPAWK
jgi:hypothetical protein